MKALPTGANVQHIGRVLSRRVSENNQNIWPLLASVEKIANTHFYVGMGYLIEATHKMLSAHLVGPHEVAVLFKDVGGFPA